MRKNVEETVQPGQPALIVTYGNATRKCRPLDRDVLVVGRAQGCDLGLISPEVAPIHCVIVRLADGWHIRDCTGRGATRVNGRAVQEEALRDGDTLQIGTFSFTARLPSECTTPVPPAHVTVPAPGPGAEPTAVDHLQRSRRKLARLALALRRRLRQTEGDGLAARQQELEQQAEALWAFKRDYENRMVRLEEAEREACATRSALQQRLEEAERELAERRAEAEARAACEPTTNTPPAPEPTPDAEALREAARRLEVRGRELDCYAAYLRRCGLTLQAPEQGEPDGQPREEAEPPRAEAAPPQEEPAPAAEKPRSRGRIDVGRLREKAQGQRGGNLQDRMARIKRLKEGLTGGSAPGDAPKPAVTASGLRRRKQRDS
jgi:pSer/pThr/pTyr-binding forkhead associated (FHA) protein